MAKAKKALFIVLIVGALFSASLLTAFLYYYHHPSKAKSLLEQSISRITGTVCTIQGLSYSLDPLSFRAEGVSILAHIHGFQLEIPQFSASMSLDGPFGRKTLTFTSFTLRGFTFRAHQEMIFDEIKGSDATPSLLTRVLLRLASALLFRDVKFQAIHVSDGHVFVQFRGMQLALTDVRAAATPDHLVEITCGGKLEIPSEDTVCLGRDIRVSSGQVVSLSQPEMRATLTITDGDFQNPLIHVDDISIRSGLSYSHGKRTLDLRPLEAEWGSVRVSKETVHVAVPAKGTLTAEASVDLTMGRVQARGFHFLLQDILACKGDMGFEYAGNRRLTLDGMDGQAQVTNVFSLLPDALKKALPPLRADGLIRWQGGAGAYEKDGAWGWACDLRVHLDENKFSYRSPAIVSQGTASAELRAKGEFPDLETTLKLNAHQLSLQSRWVDFNSARLDLVLGGKKDLFHIHGLALKVPEGKGRIQGTEVPVEDLRLRLEAGTIDLEKRRLLLPGIEIETPLLKNVCASIEGDEGGIAFSTKGTDTHLTEFVRALKVFPPGWKWASRDGLDAGFSLKKNGQWRAFSRVSLEGSSFENPDLTIAGAQVSMNLAVEADGNLNRSVTSIRGSLNAKEGEFLLHRLYLDLNKNAISLSMDGTYDQTPKTLSLAGIDFGLKDILGLRASGTLGRASKGIATDVSITVPVTPLRPLFQHFLLDPFRQDFPALANLDVKGNIGATLELKGTLGDLTCVGRLKWDEGSVRGLDDSFSLQGITLDLPVSYQAKPSAGAPGHPGKRKPPQNEKPRGESIKGSLTIESMALPLFQEQALSVGLEASPNQWSIPSPTLLKVPGGEMAWGPLVVENPYSGSPSVRTSLSFSNLRLDTVLSKIWSRPIEGTARGRLDVIELLGEKVSTRGQIKAEIFGGTVAIDDLGADNLRSPSPLFHLDAVWNGLLLQELTRGTSFGEVQGALKGYVKDLEMARLEPQKFTLLLETEPREGIPQRISVRAVDNIAQIGGGQNAFAGVAGVVTSLFKDFPYDRIGVRATLENDVFRVNGTIREGGVEYLVKRGGFSGVSVINQSPDSTISFKDMIKRIKRVTDSRGGAVVR